MLYDHLLHTRDLEDLLDESIRDICYCPGLHNVTLSVFGLRSLSAEVKLDSNRVPFLEITRTISPEFAGHRGLPGMRKVEREKLVSLIERESGYPATSKIRQNPRWEAYFSCRIPPEDITVREMFSSRRGIDMLKVLHELTQHFTIQID